MHDKESHGKSIEHLIGDFETHLERGLTQQQAQERVRNFGANELREKPRPGFLALLWDQFNNYLVIILIVAALISLLLGEYVDSIAIMFIVVLNAVVGVIQESKAEQALAALKKMSAPNAQVIRDGHQVTIPSREIVAGDIVLLEAGNYVPRGSAAGGERQSQDRGGLADGRIGTGRKECRCRAGQGHPPGRPQEHRVHGHPHHLWTRQGARDRDGHEHPDRPDRGNDPVVRGRGHAAAAEARASGQGARDGVPGHLRDRVHLRALPRYAPADAFSSGFLNYLEAEKKDIINLFMTAVSLAIAAVPEGLPAIVTICLALGMQRMIKHHALIRKLPAVETLGCATVVCSDKTGTLTQNEMTVVQGWAGGKRLRITGEGYKPTGSSFWAASSSIRARIRMRQLLLHGALLCNDAKLEETCDEAGNASGRSSADPTEAAMVVAAARAAYRAVTSKRHAPHPGDSVRFRPKADDHDPPIRRQARTPPGRTDARLLAFVKGAPDVILDLCGHACSPVKPST